MPKKGIVILGCTGSIGKQTLDTVRAFPDRFNVVGLAAGHNFKLLKEQIEEFKPRLTFSANDTVSRDLSDLAKVIPMEDMVCDPEVAVVMVGTTGRAGLLPTIKALEEQRTVCLANKEVITMAGDMVTRLAREKGGTLLPVDSEPSAIWQCLRGEEQTIRRLIITASGGPFRNTPTNELERVTPEQALAHPTWKMGRRITVDSSTMMNKGFEVIEAHWLFNVAWEQIEVVIHPQSLIDSMVEFNDGSVKAQLSPPDMRLPIQYALLYPERHNNDSIPRLDTSIATSMTFEPLNPRQYPCFDQAVQAGKQSGTYPAVLTAADEVAVHFFLEGRIAYTDIPKIVGGVLETHISSSTGNLEDILEADEWARNRATEIADSHTK